MQLYLVLGILILNIVYSSSDSDAEVLATTLRDISDTKDTEAVKYRRGVEKPAVEGFLTALYEAVKGEGHRADPSKQPEPTETVTSTTIAPTTVAPTTVAPTTVAPTTVALTTVAPTTLPDTKVKVVLDRKRFEDLATQMKKDSDELVQLLRNNSATVLEDFIRITLALEQEIRTKSDALQRAVHTSADELASDNIKLVDAFEKMRKKETDVASGV